MADFFEFIQLCMQPVTLPITAALVFVFGYWTLFIIGAVGLDSLDFDLDMDADVDFDVDVDADVDLNTDLDTDVGTDGAHVHGSSVWVSFLRFFNVGDVPLMVLVSVLVFSMWAIALLSNQYLNPSGHIWVGIGLLIPNLVLSMLITKIVTTPIRELFRHANTGGEPPTKIVGKTCIITTGEVTQTFGQAQIQPDEGAPIALNVRCPEDTTLHKGDEAIVIDHDESSNTYKVVPFTLEEN